MYRNLTIYNNLFNFVIIYVIVLYISPKRYHLYLPTIHIYPSYDEVKIVIDKINRRNQQDVDFFKKTDLSIIYAFKDIVNINTKILKEIIHSVNNIIYLFKYSINRARPYQIHKELNILHSVTGNTPSFPAGHAFQAYYLAKILSNKYPEKKKKLDYIAKRCDDVRVTAGIHFPSDGQFSKYLVEHIL